MDGHLTCQLMLRYGFIEPLLRGSLPIIWTSYQAKLQWRVFQWQQLNKLYRIDATINDTENPQYIQNNVTAVPFAESITSQELCLKQVFYVQETYKFSEEIIR